MGVNDVYITSTTQTHKDKPPKSLEHDRKNDKEINILREDSWSNKQKGWKDSEGGHKMRLSVCIHKGITKEGLQAKILEGVAAATTLGDTLVEL